jgi:glycosyltransferase involved in cell wall biosynthesis
MKKNKKSLFFFTPSLLPDSDAASVRNNYLLNELALKGFRIKIHSFTTNLKFKPYSNKFSIYRRLIGEIFSGLELLFRVMISNQKYYFFSSPPFLTVLIATWGVRLKLQKYILDIRDIYPEVYFELGIIKKNSFIGKLLLSITKSFYKNASLISVTSEGQENSIKNISPTANTVIIYNGFDPMCFRPNLLKRPDFTVVFHGNLGKFQKIDLLVEIAEKFEKLDPSVKFLVMGEGPGEVYIKKSNLNNLNYLGKVNYSDIPQIISECHLGISFRSDDEISKTAMPVKIFEYIGVEIPFILTPLGEASKKFNAHDIALTFENSQKEEIIQSIINIKNNRSLYKSIVENIKKYKHLYSRKNNAEKLIQEIEKLIL